MKKVIIRSILLVLGIMSLAACQTTAPKGPSAAVTCNKCATVYYMAPTLSGPGSKLVTLKQSSRMVCPTCETNAVAILKGASVTSHKCPECGGQLVHCTAH